MANDRVQLFEDQPIRTAWVVVRAGDFVITNGLRMGDFVIIYRLSLGDFVIEV